MAKPKAVKLNHERIAHWMKNGAQPSDTVARLIKVNPGAGGLTASRRSQATVPAQVLESIQAGG